jgi:hypothetical protein
MAEDHITSDAFYMRIEIFDYELRGMNHMRELPNVW